MSEEDFLTRWSRRKREVAAAEKAAPTVEDAKPVEKQTADEPHEMDAEARVKIEAALPPLESITELSDVAAFLKAGVPADLTRAALRRVWTVDPSIRDFVGLAENSWDFTDPAAMPGFGPLEDTEQIRRMIAQVVDQIGKGIKPAGAEPEGPRETSSYSNAIVPQSDDAQAPQDKALPDEAKLPAPAQSISNEVLLQSNKDDAATRHHLREEKEKQKQVAHRVHGRALPE